MLLEGKEHEVDKHFARPSHLNENLSPNEPEPPFNTRLPVGRAELHPAGNVRQITMDLDLYTATATGTITTDKGQISFTAVVHTGKPVMFVRLECTGEERKAHWEVFSFYQFLCYYSFKGFPFPAIRISTAFAFKIVALLTQTC